MPTPIVSSGDDCGSCAHARGSAGGRSRSRRADRSVEGARLDAPRQAGSRRLDGRCRGLPRDRRSACALRRLVAHRHRRSSSRRSSSRTPSRRGCGSRSGSGSRSRRSSCSCRCSSSCRRASRRSSSRRASCSAACRRTFAASGTWSGRSSSSRTAGTRSVRHSCWSPRAAPRPDWRLHWPLFAAALARAVRLRPRELGGAGRGSRRQHSAAPSGCGAGVPRRPGARPARAHRRLRGVPRPAVRVPARAAAARPDRVLRDASDAGRVDHAVELGHAYRGTALLLGDVVEADDAYTGSHSRHVVDLVLSVCDRLELSPKDRRDAEFTALLHDVGKIRIPSEIINKPGPLDRGRTCRRRAAHDPRRGDAREGRRRARRGRAPRALMSRALGRSGLPGPTRRKRRFHSSPASCARATRSAR